MRTLRKVRLRRSWGFPCPRCCCHSLRYHSKHFGLWRTSWCWQARTPIDPWGRFHPGCSLFSFLSGFTSFLCKIFVLSNNAALKCCTLSLQLTTDDVGKKTWGIYRLGVCVAHVFWWNVFFRSGFFSLFQNLLLSLFQILAPGGLRVGDAVIVAAAEMLCLKSQLSFTCWNPSMWNYILWAKYYSQPRAPGVAFFPQGSEPTSTMYL